MQWCQGTSQPPQPSLLSAEAVDPFWKCVRRGVAPAFNPANLRCVIGFGGVVSRMLQARLYCLWWGSVTCAVSKRGPAVTQ